LIRASSERPLRSTRRKESRGGKKRKKMKKERKRKRRKSVGLLEDYASSLFAHIQPMRKKGVGEKGRRREEGGSWAGTHDRGLL